MSQLFRRLRQIRSLTHALRASRSFPWAWLLVRHRIDVRMWPCEPKEGGLFFPCLGAIIPGPSKNVLLAGFQRAVKLHEAGVTFDTSVDSVRATVGPISVQVETTEELLILEEIYLDGAYHFNLSGPLLVIDIGMNVAYTALYFAAMHLDAIVCAYEPFAPTFRSAEANIALNPALQQRIRAHRFGLSDSHRSIDVDYADFYRGSVGVYGVPADLCGPNEVKRERCEVRDAATEIEKLSNEHPDRRLVLKVDCEGSEYAIIRRLAQKAMLDRIDLMMIECHRRASEHDPAALRASLSAHGFGCVHRQPNSSDISMLYVFKEREHPSSIASLPL
jgi:FkbM family methyltransferase